MLNNMNNFGMNNLAMNNIGMNNIGINNIDMNNIGMLNAGLNNFGMNNNGLNNIGINNAGLNQMNMNNQPNLIMDENASRIKNLIQPYENKIRELEEIIRQKDFEIAVLKDKLNNVKQSMKLFLIMLFVNFLFFSFKKLILIKYYIYLIKFSFNYFDLFFI